MACSNSDPRPVLTAGWREGLSDDRLADVGGDEQVGARSETVAFLKEFIKENDDQGGDDELHDEEKADAGAEVT